RASSSLESPTATSGRAPSGALFFRRGFAAALRVGIQPRVRFTLPAFGLQRSRPNQTYSADRPPEAPTAGARGGRAAAGTASRLPPIPPPRRPRRSVSCPTRLARDWPAAPHAHPVR